MRRAIELRSGDITPLFTVGDWILASEWHPTLGSDAEIAIREHGARKTAPRTLMFREAMVEVIGCLRCGKDHDVADCPRRSLADPDHADEWQSAAARHWIRPDDVDERHPEIMEHVRSVERKQRRPR